MCEFISHMTLFYYFKLYLKITFFSLRLKLASIGDKYEHNTITTWQMFTPADTISTGCLRLTRKIIKCHMFCIWNPICSGKPLLALVISSQQYPMSHWNSLSVITTPIINITGLALHNHYTRRKQNIPFRKSHINLNSFLLLHIADQLHF